MIADFIAMRLDIEMMKTAFGNSLKVGPVEVIDAEKGYRLRLGGTDQEPFLSPWYPHPESGGENSSWMPMAVGQIVGVINPSGDPRQGVVFRGGFSDQYPPPSQDLDACVFILGGLRITLKGGRAYIDGDVRINGRLHVEEGIHEGGEGIYSIRGVWPPGPVFVEPVV